MPRVRSSRMAAGGVRSIAEETTEALRRTLAALAEESEGRRFFPNGIEVIELELETAGVEVKVRIAGGASRPAGVTGDVPAGHESVLPARTIGEPVAHEGTGIGHAPKPPVKWIASPNHASRAGHDIDTLVLHNTDGSLSSAVNRFLDPAAQVSAHYIVDRTGEIVQMVRDADVAWHAGKRDVNVRSIGVEIVAWKTALGMTAPQEQSVRSLCRFILDAYSISLERVKPHRSIKATACPGWIWKADSDLAAWKKAKLA